MRLAFTRNGAASGRRGVTKQVLIQNYQERKENVLLMDRNGPPCLWKSPEGRLATRKRRWLSAEQQRDR